MSQTPPFVSVILPVYNGGPYLQSAVSSILSQSHKYFELIIIDDGSTDDSAHVLCTFKDERIRLFRQANQGLASTLNRGISVARGSYIARQDQDDISMPDRLSKQVAYMQAHPECALLGTWAQIMEINRLSDRFHRHPTDPGELRYELLFNNPFVHSSVMLRKTVMEQLGGYCTDPERQPPEDYELWSRIARVAEISNLPENLLIYREIPTSMSRTGISPFQRRLVRLCAENIAHATGTKDDDPDVQAIAALTHGSAELLHKKPDFQRMHQILEKAIERNTGAERQALLKREAYARVSNLRASWIAYRSPLALTLQRQGKLRSLAKRLLAIWNRLRER
jgi:glycosyltransferase involved in cell wall biosynthesis